MFKRLGGAFSYLQALYSAYTVAAAGLTETSTLPEFLTALEALAGPVDAFMENVFVMAEEPELRANRLTLLSCVAALPNGIFDPAELPGF